MGFAESQAGIEEGNRERISDCLRTFCRLGQCFDRVSSAVLVCCVRSHRRSLRAIVVQECCPVATARPRRCCCRTVDVHVPKTGRGTLGQRTVRNRCAAEAAAGAALLDRHVSIRSRTTAGDSMHGENGAAGQCNVQVALVHP
jgi:hypothetical protein